MSVPKNLTRVSSALPRMIVTWDKAERIIRNQEIWKNPDSIVHRLPTFYKRAYWKNILTDATPVHYRIPDSRLEWDTKRLTMHENEVYPIIGFHPPEADKGLWGGETVVKGYILSKPFVKKKVLPRRWVPHFFFPSLKESILYSEVLDKHMKVVVTERALRLIDQHFGLDFYLLETPEIDIASKLGNKLKREILIALANESYYKGDEEKRDYIRQKYAKFVMPIEEAEWVGLDLNEACRKQQDLEDSLSKEPKKFIFERELVEKLKSGKDMVTNEEDYAPRRTQSMFGEKLLGKYFNRFAR
ncbi:hypothetical protein AB6A40_004907 [Gnathostoma spinigerum]|uniref:Large ribosomal subunit protein bL28m n=1 Tax=Gnathostoma spinigerum TaxID=75299 RepID=A0ABD6EE17_9BILA